MHRDAQLIAEAYGNRISENVGMQGVKLSTDTALKTLVSQIFNDPDKFWELLKKVPGLYAALLIPPGGNVKKLQEIFLALGVDVKRIADAVMQSQTLFAQYQRDPSSVQIRKAVAAQPLRATPVK
jgi:hypothetical protein